MVDGVARVDPGARLPGRGTYACSPTCLKRVANRRALSRALRGKVELEDGAPLHWPPDTAPL